MHETSICIINSDRMGHVHIFFPLFVIDVLSLPKYFKTNGRNIHSNVVLLRENL